VPRYSKQNLLAVPLGALGNKLLGNVALKQTAEPTFIVVLDVLPGAGGIVTVGCAWLISSSI